MIGLTEAEFGLSRAYNRNLAVMTAEAQAIIDRQVCELRAAKAEIRRLQDALVLERGRRRATEIDARRH